jgi:hypothetical protein
MFAFPGQELQRKSTPDSGSEAICASFKSKKAIPFDARKLCSGAQ